MAVALYRKYRPRTFAEVIGQDHVTVPLTQALRTGRLHHAYLFSGPRGCGKTSSARILARSLNCAAGPTPEPCGECESCRSLAGDGSGSVDVIEIDAASHGGVDDARDLRERAFFTPVAGRYKIYVIDEAHMVSSAGFNALLKLVEEPPEHVKFVFATTEPDKVLPTIRSRTHHYPFRLVPPRILRPWLERVCEAEGVAVEPAVFPLLVRAGGGSVRDTLSVLDQLIAGADPREGIRYEQAVALLGVTDAALLDEVVDALAAGDGAALFAAVDRVVEAGHDPRRFAADLLERLRDLIVLQRVPDAAEKGLLDAPEDTLARMSAQAAKLGPATLTRCAEVVHSGLVEMRGTTSPRLLLELICARMLLPGADGSESALLQRLERLERRLGAGAGAEAGGSAGAVGAPAPGAPEPAAAASGAGPVSAAAPPAASPTDPTGSPAAAPYRSPAASPPSPATGHQASAGPSGAAGAGGLDAATVRRVWDEIVTTVGRTSKRAAAVVREAAVRQVEGDTLVLAFRHRVHAEMLESAPQPLLHALHAVLGGTWRVRCETGGGPAEAPVSTPPAATAATPPATPAATPPVTAPASAPTASPAAAGSGPRPGAARSRGSRPAESGSAAGRTAPAGGSTPDPEDEHQPEPARPADPRGGATARGVAAPAGDDPSTERRVGEQEAIELLRRTLGAEKIGEVAP
ncbi:MAG TPA: DNA polymerase III subunit gamma and tau [Natronosporangium sp.]